MNTSHVLRPTSYVRAVIRRRLSSVVCSLFIFLSFYLFIFVNPAHAEGFYINMTYYNDGLTKCENTCVTSYCPTGQQPVPLKGCDSPGLVCCQKPQSTCSGTCVPLSSCDNAGTGEACAGGLTCCGMLKQTSVESFLGPTAGQPAQQQQSAQPPPVSYEGRMCPTPAGVQFPCPFDKGTAENISNLIGQIIRWCLGLIGALFFAMFVWGGVLYMTAGSSKRAEEGQKTLVNAAIGMAIVILSHLVVSWVLDIIGAAIS